MGGGGESNTLCEDIAAAFQCGFVPQMCANWYAKLQFSSCIIKHVILFLYLCQDLINSVSQGI